MRDVIADNTCWIRFKSEDLGGCGSIVISGCCLNNSLTLCICESTVALGAVKTSGTGNRRLLTVGRTSSTVSTHWCYINSRRPVGPSSPTPPACIPHPPHKKKRTSSATIGSYHIILIISNTQVSLKMNTSNRVKWIF